MNRNRPARSSAALAAVALLLSACTGGSTEAAPAAHPVSSAPPARQVLLALRHTQESGGAVLRQTATFTAGRTTAVQDVTGRVDPGPDAVRERARRACAGEEGPRSRTAWSPPAEWSDLREGRATCYRLS
ncbi:hypothetical protein HHL19_04100 [Streptomyces sp. R302]|uniref:hypothetical protein n=1 Tax=unclassified Streptomyces TaxID=2593676 RepID=UPI00145F5786|nr:MULTISPECIES: hypothetical protein [unclassified Streptomyces]NML49529.1 hypothetical protein [Streptomyces sp. R301]NML77856.1 hypothetical protein [Streptomyces sp. R302]